MTTWKKISPRAHDIIRTWLPEFESALLIYDEGGGLPPISRQRPFHRSGVGRVV